VNIQERILRIAALAGRNNLQFGCEKPGGRALSPTTANQLRKRNPDAVCDVKLKSGQTVQYKRKGVADSQDAIDKLEKAEAVEARKSSNLIRQRKGSARAKLNNAQIVRLRERIAKLRLKILALEPARRAALKSLIAQKETERKAVPEPKNWDEKVKDLEDRIAREKRLAPLGKALSAEAQTEKDASQGKLMRESRKTGALKALEKEMAELMQNRPRARDQETLNNTAAEKIEKGDFASKEQIAAKEREYKSKNHSPVSLEKRRAAEAEAGKIGDEVSVNMQNAIIAAVDNLAGNKSGMDASDPIIEFPKVYAQILRKYPDLSIARFKDALLKISENEKIDMHPLNDFDPKLHEKEFIFDPNAAAGAATGFQLRLYYISRR